MCRYIYFCAYRMSALFACCYTEQNLLVSVHQSIGYLLLILQNFLKYYGFRHFLFYGSGLLRVRCYHFLLALFNISCYLL